jgi:hypothetical protein
MPFEAKRFRHVAVAVLEVSVSRFWAATSHLNMRRKGMARKRWRGYRASQERK